MILSYSSPWPKQDYKHIKNVKSDYSGRYVAITRTVSIIVIFFLTNLLATPIAIQDMILQMATTAMIGYTFFVHIQLYYVYPALVIIPTLFICGLVFFIRKYYWKSGNKEDEKNGINNNVTNTRIIPSDPENGYTAHKLTGDSEIYSNLTANRRQSLQQGLYVASQLKDILQTTDDALVNEEEGKEAQSSSSSSSLSDIDLPEEEEEGKESEVTTKHLEMERNPIHENSSFEFSDDDEYEDELWKGSIFDSFEENENEKGNEEDLKNLECLPVASRGSSELNNDDNEVKDEVLSDSTLDSLEDNEDTENVTAKAGNSLDHEEKSMLAAFLLLVTHPLSGMAMKTTNLTFCSVLTLVLPRISNRIRKTVASEIFTAQCLQIRFGWLINFCFTLYMCAFFSC
jgi:hypothetical protein